MSMLLLAARRCAAAAPGVPAVRRALGPGAARRLSDMIDAEVVRPYRAAGGTGPPPVNQRLLDVLEKSGPLDASAMWATVEAAQVRVPLPLAPPRARLTGGARAGVVARPRAPGQQDGFEAVAPVPPEPEARARLGRRRRRAVPLRDRVEPVREPARRRRGDDGLNCRGVGEEAAEALVARLEGGGHGDLGLDEAEERVERRRRSAVGPRQRGGEARVVAVDEEGPERGSDEDADARVGRERVGRDLAEDGGERQVGREARGEQFADVRRGPRDVVERPPVGGPERVPKSELEREGEAAARAELGRDLGATLSRNVFSSAAF